MTPADQEPGRIRPTGRGVEMEVVNGAASGRAHVVLCGRTLPQVGFAERVRLAAGAGFGFVSLMGPDLPELTAGPGLARSRSMLDAHGVQVAELDALVGWLPGGTPPAWLGDVPDQRAWHEVADAVGARTLNLVDLAEGPTPSTGEAAEAFASVCRGAAEHDLLVSLEFVPWSRVPDLPTAAAIVAAADQPNGGVMLDTWHLFRSGGTLDDVAAVPARRVVGIQINDAPESERGARRQQAVQERLLPGTGSIGVATLLELLDRRGCDAPIGLEVTSARLAAMDADEVVDLLAEAVDAVLPGR